MFSIDMRLMLSLDRGESHHRPGEFLPARQELPLLPETLGPCCVPHFLRNELMICVLRLSVLLCLFAVDLAAAADPVSISGIYPHLAMFNDEGECGTGAVVPWADRLWVVTYAPHSPTGSSDKLYEITPELQQKVRPESIGGTPANRMIHRESRQLFIGPYVIGADRTVRVIPYSQMFGRPTGNARHLFDPAGKIYYATMEEGLYEVDVKTLAVTELWADEQKKEGRHARLPGYHGKGLYSAQGRLVYANNGEHGAAAQSRPETPSGVLAQWDGKSDDWQVVRRNQFTEVTGPHGITGESLPSDPLWTVGWDHRSLILMCLQDGQWHTFRLPKASHSYDGAHGWNTEWPRIREIGETSLLMTMHGQFWHFPRNFGPGQTAGLTPRSTYLKVVGDFCQWNGRVVLGCDDTARNEFLNKRRAKGTIAAPQSQSNLWFLSPGELDHLGPVLGRGAVWLEDDVTSGTTSDPMLCAGFERRGLHLTHQSEAVATVRLECDRQGTGQWTVLKTVMLPPRGTAWLDLSDDQEAQWVRVVAQTPLSRATAWFTGSNTDPRTSARAALVAGLATHAEQHATGGLVRARAQNKRTLHFAAVTPAADGVQDVGLYELDAALTLKRVDDAAAHDYLKANAAIPTGVLQFDDASVIFLDEQNRRWRLPRGAVSGDTAGSLGPARVCREVATERDLFHAAGTFFELPAENAGGFAKVRPVATHDCQISDFCSYRGLLVMSGVANAPPQTANPHVIRSDDGRAALWVGAIDDVWKFGKPRGVGGPWKMSLVTAKTASDPYLLTGYDHRTMTFAHQHSGPVTFAVECDVTGTGLWVPYRTITVPAGSDVDHVFPPAYAACWMRVTSDTDCTATVQLTYR